MIQRHCPSAKAGKTAVEGEDLLHPRCTAAKEEAKEAGQRRQVGCDDDEGAAPGEREQVTRQPPRQGARTEEHQQEE